MKKEDINLMAQLIASMEDALEKLEKADKKKDSEGILKAKRAIISFQKQLNGLL